MLAILFPNSLTSFEPLSIMEIMEIAGVGGGEIGLLTYEYIQEWAAVSDIVFTRNPKTWVPFSTQKKKNP